MTSIEDDLSGDEKADNEVSHLMGSLHTTDCYKTLPMLRLLSSKAKGRKYF